MLLVEVCLEQHSMYLFLNELQLAKVVEIIQELKQEDWVFISSFIFLENNDVYHLYPVIKIRMLKERVTKWIFVDPNGSVRKFNME
jgi:hypothetical protein